jgi:hypothetical protein
MSQQALMNYFNFDADDLSWNQKGHFTEKQKVRVLKEVKSHQVWSRVAGMLLIMIGVGHFAAARTLQANVSFWGLWALLCGAWGVIVLVKSNSTHNFTVAKVQGPANIVRTESSHKGRTSVHYELHIGGQEFSTSADLANVMMQGDRYILYYVAPSHEILSAETVSKAK